MKWLGAWMTSLLGLASEMKGMRDEFHRWQAVERAIDTERDLDARLN
jgi:hypothetical protein